MTVAIRRRLPPPPSAVFGSQEDGEQVHVTSDEVGNDRFRRRGESVKDVDKGEDYGDRTVGVSIDAVRRDRPAQVVALCCCEVAANSTATTTATSTVSSTVTKENCSEVKVTQESEQSSNVAADAEEVDKSKCSPALVEPEATTLSNDLLGGTKRNRPCSPTFSSDDSICNPFVSSRLSDGLEGDERVCDFDDETSPDDTVVTTSEDDSDISGSHDGESGTESEGNLSDESSVNSESDARLSYLPRASKRLRRRNSLGRRRFVSFAVPIVTAVFTRPKLCTNEEKCACHYTFDEMDEFRARYYRWQERRREMGCEDDDFFEDDNEDEEDGAYYDNDRREAEQDNVVMLSADNAYEAANLTDDNFNDGDFGLACQKSCCGAQSGSHVIHDDGLILDHHISTSEEDVNADGVEEKEAKNTGIGKGLEVSYGSEGDRSNFDENSNTCNELFEQDSSVTLKDNHRSTDIISKVTVLHNEDVTEYSSERDNVFHNGPLQEKKQCKGDDDKCNIGGEEDSGSGENGFFFDTEAFWNGTIMYS